LGLGRSSEGRQRIDSWSGMCTFVLLYFTVGFEEMTAKLVRLLDRVRELNLSLFVTKPKPFYTEGVFAGALIGPAGVASYMSKLTAILNWPQPRTGQQILSFLRLAGYFRDLIKNYVFEEAPLRNLLDWVQLPRRIRWWSTDKLTGTPPCKPEHTQGFSELKRIFVMKPVMHSTTGGIV
jgi:hypothetical protein